MRKKKKTNKFKQAILRYVSNNLREFFVVTIVFLIGVVLGVFFINNADEIKITEITTYINEFLNLIKQDVTIDNINLLKHSIINNISTIFVLWFAGCTVVRYTYFILFYWCKRFLSRLYNFCYYSKCWCEKWNNVCNIKYAFTKLNFYSNIF